MKDKHAVFGDLKLTLWLQTDTGNRNVQLFKGLPRTTDKVHISYNNPVLKNRTLEALRALALIEYSPTTS